ncbi:conjugative transposon protein TraK [Chitinophaga varians]|uniref:conjugative transposon protein TraK n=1 Tax=Chitinophaga varians TaxID=2202339 RepID=UPI00165F161A|nr:conjugative transposon protein TraK [Chitinophaga varians]MBC9909122.1 conjugative transposon protein TraK [Chitinophaga varians]
MFQQFKNIDKAFKYIRLFSFSLIVANIIICCYVINKAFNIATHEKSKILVLANGKLMEAVSTTRKEVAEVEIRDHVKVFHYYFFTASPDMDAIKKNITKALYLADGSAKAEYDNLQESNYYSGLVASNITQSIDADSVSVNLNSDPAQFIYYGKLRIVRTTSILTRSIVSTGQIRITESVSDNNPHGFLIEKWRIVDNRDITLQKR